MELTEELLALLRENGAVLAAAGDMRGVENCAYPAGVAVAIPMPRDVVRSLPDAPSREYLAAYPEINAVLDALVAAGETFLQKRGYKAFAQSLSRIKANADRRTAVPHKTVAARAGLGWIGKNCLLVNPEYGSALMLSSLLTDAPLRCAKPIETSRCGCCSRCVDACPAHALRDTLWSAGMPRGEIADVEACAKKRGEIMLAQNLTRPMCGRCIGVCIYTQKYLCSE